MKLVLCRDLQSPVQWSGLLWEEEILCVLPYFPLFLFMSLLPSWENSPVSRFMFLCALPPAVPLLGSAEPAAQ